jgi:hypothetical protein
MSIGAGGHVAAPVDLNSDGSNQTLVTNRNGSIVPNGVGNMLRDFYVSGSSVGLPGKTDTLALGKRIKNLDSRPLKILHVPGSNRQVVAARDRCDIAVFNRHRFACRL